MLGVHLREGGTQPGVCGVTLGGLWETSLGCRWSRLLRVGLGNLLTGKASDVMVSVLKELQPGGHGDRARILRLLRVFVVWVPSLGRAPLAVPTHALLTDWTAGPGES